MIRITTPYKARKGRKKGKLNERLEKVETINNRRRRRGHCGQERRSGKETKIGVKE